MEKLIAQAEALRLEIKRKKKEIDNPVLTMSILSELSFFIENAQSEEGE